MRFSLFWKPNQALKQIDRASMHRPTTFKSIANGVFTQLAGITSDIAANRNKQTDELYLDHAKSLNYGKQMEKEKINQSNQSRVNRINIWCIL
eukprot:14438663-Ditylum_brightwellii.AAC.1